MELALRGALGTAEVSRAADPLPEQSRRPAQSPTVTKQEPSTRSRSAITRANKSESASGLPAKKSRGTPKPKSHAKPHRTKRSKSAAAIATDRAGVSLRKVAASAEQRAHRASPARLGADKKAASRLAFKAARQRLGLATKSGPSPIDQQSFDELKRGWFSTLNYLARFEPLDPAAPDVTAARRRLEEIELEWERRSCLRPSDPGYFEWPSTAAPKGVGGVGVTDWEEIGMLGYLGYHVGRTSELTAQHRRAVLSQIFSMRLPPLNSLGYMEQMGLADEQRPPEKDG